MDPLASILTNDNLNDPFMQSQLQRLTLKERELLSLATGTMVQYYGEEVTLLRNIEEQAALKAMPLGHEIHTLNGLNVGCGSRPIHPALLGVDLEKQASYGFQDDIRPSVQIRAMADALPFKSSTVDFIVALYILQSEMDPVATVHHWLDIVKPGGGIGIILPDWRFTWDARKDHHSMSHRWNPTPELLSIFFEKYWSGQATLEHLDTYSFRISFDVILRKHGDFQPFDYKSLLMRPTGNELIAEGA